MPVIICDSGVIPPLAIGSALMEMIFARGPISGGDYDPALTLGVFFTNRSTPRNCSERSRRQ
jgi:glycerol uptake facilitator-like aquaporin